MSSQTPPQPPQQGSDLPTHARERLDIMRGDATHKALFTSDLSVNEFLLVREAGFDPVGLVVGSSIYHIGYQMAAWNQNQEMNVLTQAMYHARADGIVGVRLEVTRHEWGESLAEFVAIGTAIRARNGQSYRNARGLPFTSDLSGQDFWTLLRTGYRPVGMVMGNCVYHVARQGMGQWFKQVGQNVEMSIIHRPSTMPASWRWNACKPRPSASEHRAWLVRRSMKAAMAGVHMSSSFSPLALR